MSVLEVKGLFVSYGRVRIVSDASFTLREGRICGIVGANGCGKTTLIKAVCGLIPREGSVSLSGKELTGLTKKQIAREIAYVPQKSSISTHITVVDVVTMGFNPYLSVFSYPSFEMKKAALSSLESVGLKGRENDDYLTLSEGQKQLCLLARAMLTPALAYIFDEPESALDFSNRLSVFDLLCSRVKKTASCALVSLHDPDLALNCCHDLILMSDKSVQLVDLERASFEELERLFLPIYGRVKLHRINMDGVRTHTVMLREN